MKDKDRRIVVFDYFGTLFDISGLSGQISRLLDTDGERFLEMWRRKQLEYSYLITLMERYESFTKLTDRALRYTAKYLRISMTDDVVDDLMKLWTYPILYPEAVDCLTGLKPHHLSVLSNGDPEMLGEGLDRAKIRDMFENIISVETAGVFKPHRRAYSLATNLYETEPQDIVFVSSNGWDASGASEFGFDTVWVNRSGLPAEELDQKPNHVVESLREIPSIVEHACK